METQKSVLLLALLVLTFLLYQKWDETFPGQDRGAESTVVAAESNKQQGTFVPNVPIAKTQTKAVTNNFVPSVNSDNSAPLVKEDSELELITIKTDVLEYKINPVGGDIVQVKLLKYNNSLDDKQPMRLLSNNESDFHIAPNGLTGVNGPDTQDSRAEYSFSKQTYILDDASKDLKVDLNLNQNGTKITKSFIFKRNSYDVDVAYNISNNSNSVWSGNIFSVLKRNKDSSKSGSFISPTGFSGLAVYDLDNKFQKISPDKIEQQKSWSTTQGWAAMMQHYFISAWIPNANDNYQYVAKANGDNSYMVTLIGPAIKVAPGEQVTKSMKFYAGPENAKQLGALAAGLNRTVDYGVMWPIASLIFLLMSKIYGFVGNWGWAIILVTIIIKLLFYKLSSSSYRSMAKLKVLTPKIEQLRKRYGEDREKMGKAMMELYKKEKVNPLGGCLPMLIQLPFFIALYWVIIESVELRQAPFMLWIQDLSVKDPYYILPILMGLAMLGQQKLSPAPADPTQEKVMLMMPVVFTLMFMYFPAGLVLYWVVNTVTSILQQWWIMKTVNTEVALAKSKGK